MVVKRVVEAWALAPNVAHQLVILEWQATTCQNVRFDRNPHSNLLRSDSAMIPSTPSVADVILQKLNARCRKGLSVTATTHSVLDFLIS